MLRSPPCPRQGGRLARPLRRDALLHDVGDGVVLRLNDDDLVALDEEGVVLDLRHFAGHVRRNWLHLDALRHGLADRYLDVVGGLLDLHVPEDDLAQRVTVLLVQLDGPAAGHRGLAWSLCKGDGGRMCGAKLRDGRGAAEQHRECGGDSKRQKLWHGALLLMQDKNDFEPVAFRGGCTRFHRYRSLTLAPPKRSRQRGSTSLL